MSTLVILLLNKNKTVVVINQILLVSKPRGLLRKTNELLQNKINQKKETLRLYYAQKNTSKKSLTVEMKHLYIIEAYVIIIII